MTWLTTENGTRYYAVATVTIPSINCTYPVLNETTEELLKIAPCKFWGCDPNEVGNMLLNSDLLASPVKIAKNGDRDGFPTVIFEAMAYGLPVLTTKVSAIPEIIKDHVNGFIIEPENPRLLADKILEILELSDDELFEIRKTAQKDVSNISSVDKTMNKYLETINEVLFDEIK